MKANLRKEEYEEEMAKLSKYLNWLKDSITKTSEKKDILSGKLEKIKKKNKNLTKEYQTTLKEFRIIEDDLSLKKQKKIEIDEESTYADSTEDVVSFIKTIEYLFDSSKIKTAEIQVFLKSPEAIILKNAEGIGKKILELKKKKDEIKKAQVELSFFDKKHANKNESPKIKSYKSYDLQIVYRNETMSISVKEQEKYTIKYLKNQSCNYFSLDNKMMILVDEHERIWQKKSNAYKEQKNVKSTII